MVDWCVKVPSQDEIDRCERSFIMHHNEQPIAKSRSVNAHSRGVNRFVHTSPCGLCDGGVERIPHPYYVERAGS